MDSVNTRELVEKANQIIRDDFEIFKNFRRLFSDLNKNIYLDEKYILNEKNFTKLNIFMGNGAAGEVFLAKDNTNGKIVAIKDVRFNNELEALYIISCEVAFMTYFKHENLVECFGFFMSGDRIKIVMEYCEGGNGLNAYLNLRLSTKQKIKISLDVAKGLKYLSNQKPKLTHRDIKASNILFNVKISNGNVDFIAKISDYGFSRNLYPLSIYKCLTNIGTPIYTPPESMIGIKNTSRYDVYSFGISIFELFSEKTPYHDFKKNFNVLAMECALNKLRPTILFLPEATPQEMIELMQQCWLHEISERPNFEEIVERLEDIWGLF